MHQSFKQTLTQHVVLTPPPKKVTDLKKNRRHLCAKHFTSSPPHPFPYNKQANKRTYPSKKTTHTHTHTQPKQALLFTLFFWSIFFSMEIEVLVFPDSIGYKSSAACPKPQHPLWFPLKTHTIELGCIHHLVGLVVKVSASWVADQGFDSSVGIFPGRVIPVA